jgi:hypothetical protein
MTAAFVTNGKQFKEYGYYHCCKPGCALRGKTVLKKVIEKQFNELLIEKDVVDEVIELTGAIYNDAWGTEIESREDKCTKMKEEIKDLEIETDGLTELSYQTKIQVVRNQYERRIERLASRIEELQAEIDKKPETYNVSFQTCYEKVGQLLKSPYTVWQSWSAREKQKLFLFFFDGNLEYVKGEGFSNPKMSLGIRVLGQIGASKTADVDIDRNTLNQFVEFIYKWYFILESLIPHQPKYSSIDPPIQHAA